MPEPVREFLHSYGFCNKALEVIALNVADIAVNTDTKITFEEAKRTFISTSSSDTTP